MNKKNGIGDSKPKQSRRQGESAPEMPVGRAYAVELLAVGKVLRIPSLSSSIRIGFEYVAFSFEPVFEPVCDYLKTSLTITLIRERNT